MKEYIWYVVETDEFVTSTWGIGSEYIDENGIGIGEAGIECLELGQMYYIGELT
jgi:hypothetical protein